MRKDAPTSDVGICPANDKRRNMISNAIMLMVTPPVSFILGGISVWLWIRYVSPSWPRRGAVVGYIPSAFPIHLELDHSSMISMYLKILNFDIDFIDFFSFMVGCCLLCGFAGCCVAALHVHKGKQL